jgi:hypothetical protein
MFVFLIWPINIFRNVMIVWLQLVERPLELELVPGERYPSQRAVNAAVPPALVLRVRDMPHMARYVYDMYIDTIRDHKDEVTTPTTLLFNYPR